MNLQAVSGVGPRGNPTSPANYAHVIDLNTEGVEGVCRALCGRGIRPTVTYAMADWYQLDPRCRICARRLAVMDTRQLPRPATGGSGWSAVVDAGDVRLYRGYFGVTAVWAPTIAEVKRLALARAIPERDQWARCVREIRDATEADFL